MKTKLYALFVWFASLLVSACGGDDPVPVVENQRTVLVYMAANNSLSRFANKDLAEIKAGMEALSNSAGMHLLVYVDTGSPRLVEIEKKKNVVVETIIKEYEDRNSCGVAETLEVFNDVFGDPRFQSKSYGLIYWSHGDGWIPYPLSPSSRWVGQDTGNGDYRMNISELAEVLQKAPRFDFILFDTCFMQSIEVAYELRDYCDYYIGFPSENPSGGAAYDRMFPYLFQEGAAVKMAEATFKAYEEGYTGEQGSNDNWTMGTAIGVLKSSELQGLADATAKALSGAVEVGSDYLRRSIFDYDRRDNWSSSRVGYYDMVEMMNALVVEQTVWDEWKRAYNAATIYWATTPKIYSAVGGMFSMERASGVSHYIPTDSRQSVAEAYRSMKWYQAAGLSQLGW